ncbi:MAG: encapsulin-associated ferritin-like protein [Acetobacteraceae bacterium]
MAGEVLHEDGSKLGPEILDRHRAISTIMEELEAIDWYDQRIKASDNPQLKAVLAHNRDEEKEHASMLLEWLRRRDPELDGHLRTFLFKQGPIREAEPGGGGGAPEPAPSGGDGSLGIGSLRSGG